MLTRDATGGGTLNCGNPSNLCDGGPNPAVPCFDMRMVGFDCGGNETWSTLLTSATPDLPPYSTGPEGPWVYMIWWYQHQGRIATDGTNWAGYFCDAISTSEGGCINIHQGDRMQVVGPNGTLLSHPDEFELGCSHSWNTRIVWDDSADRFVMVCATDNEGRVSQPNPYRTVYRPADLSTLSVGDLVVASGGGYWVTASDVGTLHLFHFTEGEADMDLSLGNADASYLAPYSDNYMVAAWPNGGAITAQVLDASDGSNVSEPFTLDVPGNRYHALKGYPDGSVAYPAPGTSNTQIQDS